MSTQPPVPSEGDGTPAATAVPPVAPPPLPKTAFQKPTVKPLADASWWRLGCIPYVVLVLAAAATDFLTPMPHQFHHLGLGSAIGSVLFIAALLLLRRDLSRMEQLFLLLLGLVTAAAQVVSASVICYLGLLIAPFILFNLPKESEEPQPRGRSWWSFWFERRKKGTIFRGGCLPLVVSLFIGLALFAAFLGIFASGNPVVELVWNTLVEWWNKFVEFLHLDWDLWVHVLMWGVGALLFGFYTLARPHVKPTAKIPTPKVVEGTVAMLPHLPLISLVAINLAFLVATSTDIAFLWFHRVPEGISQTEYLHEGADSIIFASVLAALILLFLFRSSGSVRHTIVPRAAGYLLVLQTFLLAVSVFMRLYFQIEDFGFTYRRVLAGECLLMGVVALALLLAYMTNDGRFLKHLRMGFCVLVLFFFGFNIEPPTALSGDLNLYYAPTHPKWKFEVSDFRNGRFSADENLAFAAHYGVTREALERYGKHLAGNREENTDYLSDCWAEYNAASRIMSAAQNTVRRSNDSWRAWTLRNHIDLPAAQYILKVVVAAKDKK